jgi:hypothetical protein
VRGSPQQAACSRRRRFFHEIKHLRSVGPGASVFVASWPDERPAGRPKSEVPKEM